MSILVGAGAKSTNNTWEAMNLDASGNLKTTKIYSNTVDTLLSGSEIRDTSAHDATEHVDISGYALSSIRVDNSLDSALTLYFRNDRTTGSSAYMNKTDGSYLSVSVAAGAKAIITPADLPELPYMKLIRPIVICAQAPTSGAVSIYVISKR